MVRVIQLASIQHYEKEHESRPHSATTCPAPDCSIHYARTVVWPKGLRVFAVVASLCDPKAKDIEKGAVVFTMMTVEGTLTLP